MVGGTWVIENKKRPGAYVNVKTNVVNSAVSDRGIVLLPLVMSWGQSKVVTVDADSNFFRLLGYDPDAAAMLPVRECLKRARQVKVYRINGGSKAAVTVGRLTVTAACGGVRGNDLMCKIEAVDGGYRVRIFLDDVVVDVQQAVSVDELQDNEFVTFAGSGALTATAGVKLAGGTDTAAAAADYSKFFTAAQVEDFDVVAVDTKDAAVKALTVNFIKKMRDDEGVAVQAVLADYAAADCEGVISVKNGVVLSDGVVIDKYKAVYWVAGATAGAAINESNTYSVYEDSVDVDEKYLNSEIIAGLDEGSWIFTAGSKGALVEQDINTLTTFSAAKGSILRKNRVLRVLDALTDDIKEMFNGYFLGRVNNDDDGRNLFKAQIIGYLERLQAMAAIADLDKQADVQVKAGADADSVVVSLAVRPVDSIEKLYMTVVVS